jgi:hypothetical protein
MDATHGMQKYGLKLVTVHVKDEEDKGAIRKSASTSKALVMTCSQSLPGVDHCEV